MKSNSVKTLRNSAIAFIAQIISFLLVFINRKVFLAFLSLEYLGYQSLFSNVFTLLSVAELGVGQAISYRLYKQIVNKNYDEIGRLMYVYKVVYRVIAAFVLALGIICYFLLPYIIKNSTLDWWYITIIYFLQLSSVVASYFLSYRRVIFTATQQEYKVTITDLSVSIAIQILQLLFLAIFRNYLIYLVINLSTSVIQNFIIKCLSDKEFFFLKKKQIISRSYLKSINIFSDVKNVVIHRLSYAIYDGTDNIIISSFLGVSFVALYGNYHTIHSSVVKLFVRKLLHPIQATLGNILYSNRSKDQLWSQFKMFDVFSFFFASQIALGFFVFYQPFIELWLGGQYLLPFSFVVLFCITIYFGLVWEIVYKYRAVLGDFRQDRWFLVTSAVLNICVSLVFVQIWGITGIQFGTLIAFIPIAIGRIRFVVKNYFKESMTIYLAKHFLLFLLFSSEAIICYLVLYNMPVTIPFFIIRFLVWLVVPISINTLVFCKNKDFIRLVRYFKDVIYSSFTRRKK